ncbi:MAG: PD-(D/E)XK nuclease family protein, partial [Hylemonella sp.]
YKTELREVTSRRIKEPLEDTQLAFYAALMPEERLRAAYVSLVEREAVRSFEQPQLADLREALLQGLRSELGRIELGAGLPALGEGRVCETCQARGLCRKDFWCSP